MKSKSIVCRSAIALAVSAAAIQFSYAQTVSIDDVTPIPGTQKFNTEWNVNGNTESWTANPQFTLAALTPTGGLLTGTQGSLVTDTDPNLTRSGLSILSSSDTVVEFKITKQLGDTTRVDLFWADDGGGFGPTHSAAITTIPDDGAPHTVRVTFSGQLVGKLNAFRIDPSADVAGQGKTTSLDYFRVYTSVAPIAVKTWDPNITAGVAPGGPGTWNTVATNKSWFNGSQVAWPAVSSGKDDAVIGGTVAGDITLPGGVSAAYVSFETTGYKLTGSGPLTLDGSAILKNTVGTNVTTIDVPLAGSTSNTIAGGIFVLTKAATFTGPSLVTSNLGFSVDNPLGAATNNLTFGVGGNVFFSALGTGTERTIGNDIKITSNRLVINNNALGTGLPVLPVNLTGDVELNLSAPGDIYLRRNLKMSGVVSGTGVNAGIFLAGDVGTLTLSNVANTFTNNLRWTNDSIVDAAADGSLGDAANILQFNAGTGRVRLLTAFNSARAIEVNGSAAGRIDTNGFNSTWSGGITGTAAPINSRFYKQGAGTLTLEGTNTLGGGTQVRGGTLRIPTGASLTHGSLWDNAHGVGGGATFLLDGGTFTINSSFYGVGNSTTLPGEALFQMNSGTYTHNGGAVLVGFQGSGRWVINGGDASVNQINYGDGDATRTAIADLNGGTLKVDIFARRGGDAVATINFNGTQVIAKSDKTDFLRAGAAGVTSFLVGSGGAKFDSAGFNIGIVSPLEHDSALASLDGGLVKSGPGTLTLGATNTYTGPTTVSAGVLEVNGDSLLNTGKLDIDGGRVLIPAALNEVVSTLYYNGVQQAAGVYGSTAAVGAGVIKNDTFFDVAGTGTVTVTNGPGAGGTYAAWLAMNPPATGFTPDSDNDGLPNGVENVLGTNPNTFSKGLTQVSATANSVTFQHTLNPTIASDVSYSYQWSTDLVEWKASGVANSTGTIGTIVASAPAAGVVTVTTTRTGTASGKLFTRIKATNP